MPAVIGLGDNDVGFSQDSVPKAAAYIDSMLDAIGPGREVLWLNITHPQASWQVAWNAALKRASLSRIRASLARISSSAILRSLMSVMNVGCALAGNFPALFVCRLIQGVGVGGEMPVAATYISELSKAHGRGRFFLLYELIFPVGLMATAVIASKV